MSLIDRILNPLDCNALSAVSLPDPGPFTCTDKVLNPISYALPPASSAATCAAYGVDFREPLKPFDPAEDHEITFPFSSAIEIIVLLKVEFTKAMPEDIFFFSLFFFLNFVFGTFVSKLASVLFSVFFFSFFIHLFF